MSNSGRHRILTIGLALLCAAALSAQDENSRTAPPAGKMPASPEEMEKFFSRMEDQQRVMQASQLSQLEKINPSMAGRQRQDLQRQRKIQDAMGSFRKREATEEETKKTLYPLVKQEVQAELGGLGNRIACLKKKLEFLERAEKDPDLLVRRRVEELLHPLAPQDLDHDRCRSIVSGLPL